MMAFLSSLFNAALGKYSDWRSSVFTALKRGLLLVLLPFVYVTLFLPMFSSLEASVLVVEYVFGFGLFAKFVSYFWSVHVNLCIAALLALKLTIYFNNLYSQMRQFQFQTLGGIK
jgi:hypothetical protein